MSFLPPNIQSIKAETTGTTLGGDVVLAAGTNVTLSQANNVITINASGGSPSNPHIVQATDTGFTQTGSTSYVVTQTSAAIAVSSATNKVKITVTGFMSVSDTGTVAYATIARDGSNLLSAQGFFETTADGNHTWGWPCSVTFVDTPGDTSSHTYAVYVKNSGGANTNWGTNESTNIILLEEIAA